MKIKFLRIILIGTSMSLPRLSLLEIFLIELLGWLGIWLANDYLATLLTSITSSIVFAILLIAAISEWIERSKVPRRYFWVMLITGITPVLAAGIYFLVTGGLEFIHQ